MRKILIPTDFSENAMNAIKYAMELFKYEKSEIYILHAYADEVYNTKDSMMRAIFEEVKQEVLKKSEEALARTKQEILNFSPNPKHHIFLRSEFGSLVDEANDIVDRENIDILVMGTKGATNDKNITFGSNTVQVIKYVKCPVLAIPEKYKDVHPKNVLFPTDYMLPYKRRELKLISTLAKSFVATINLLIVSNFDKLSYRQEDNRTFLETCLEQNKTSFLKMVGKDVVKVINEFIENHDIDMLVMVNSRHTYLETILYTSTIEKIGLHIKIPFLVLQNLERY